MYYTIKVKRFSWNQEKNVKLKRERGIGFEDVIVKIYGGEVLDIIDNPNKEKYPDQRVFIIDINEYVYYVPFVEDENEIFLKTIIPSRKLKNEYLGEMKK